MNATNKGARLIGILFLAAMASSLAGGFIVEWIICVPDALEFASENRHILLLGVYLELINAVSVLGIGVLMHSFLSRHSVKLATGYLSLRIVEAVMCAAIVVAPLSLLELSRNPAPGSLQDAVLLAAAQRAAVVDLLVAIFFCAGALVLYSGLYRTKLLPRFIAVWGFASAVLIFAMNILSLHIDVGLTTGMILALPIILNEIFMGVWLIVRGFDKAALKTAA